jgi:hypothetical protein
MDKDDIEKAVKGAFRPLECRTRLWDYDEKLKFKVLDEKGCLIIESCPSLDRLSDESNLETFLHNCRDEVQRKGFTLDPWKLV